MALCYHGAVLGHKKSMTSHRTARLGADHVLSDMALCWEIAAFTGSLRVLSSVASGVGEVVRQLKPRFRTPFLYILASTPEGQQHSAGVRWQLGTETWEPLPALGFGQGGVASGNVEVVALEGRLYALAEAIKFGHKEYSLQVFDLSSWDWSLLARVPCGECETLLELGGRLYILGRSLARDGSWVPQLIRYDPSRQPLRCGQELEMLPSVLTPRCYVGAGVLGGRLYAAGGYAASLPSVGAAQSLPIVERFDPESGCGADGAWESVPPMKCARFLCKVVALKDCLYVVGGLNTGGIETALERFSPSTGIWTRLAPMPPIKGAIEVSECSGKILVFGGTDLAGSRQPEVERYDVLANRWSKLPNIGDGAASLDCAALVGPPGNILAVFTETSLRDTNLVIQQYHDDRRCDHSSTCRVPAQRGRVRAVMVTEAEEESV